MPPEFNGVFGSHTQDRSHVGLEMQRKVIGSHACRAAIVEDRAVVRLMALVRTVIKIFQSMLWNNGVLVGFEFG